MAKLKEWMIMISVLILNIKLISGQVEENTKLLMERMDSVEAAQELHSVKMELIEIEVTRLKKRVDGLEIKDQDILGDLNQLDRKVTDLGISISKITPLKDESSGSDVPKKGIPTSCTDLQLLGHKINGLHLVKTTEPGRGTKIETVYCDFLSSKDVKETKVGVMDIKAASVQFHVQNKGNRGKAGQKFTFPSKDNFFNLGNGFDWSNQWFLAPYPGTYFFSLSGAKYFAHFSFFGNSNTQRRASILVYLNGKEIGEALSSQKSEYGAFSFQFSRKLEKGDKIELIMHEESAEIYLLSFTGWMLEQDLQI